MTIFRIRIDVRLTEKSVLDAIIRMQSASIVQIADAVGCSESTVLRVVSKLRRLGYISSQRTARNRPTTYEVHYERLPQSQHVS